MIRAAFFMLLAVGVVITADRSASGQLPVAPPPREIRPDGTRDPVPQPEPRAKPEDPAVVVDRIIKNSKDVGDKLAKTDTGTDTRKTQDKILSDIDALINRQEDPPPKSEQNKDQQKDKQNNDDPMMNKDPMNMPPPKNGDMPMDKMSMGMDMQKGMGGMNEPPPMGGNSRRPRMGDPMGNDRKDPGKGDPKQDPMKDKIGGGDPKEPKESKNQQPKTGGSPGGKAVGKPALPFDEDVAKDVWGHLPDKLRQQMTQYYKEDVMPKYSELLRLYYSSLAEKQANPMLPKK